MNPNSLNSMTGSFESTATMPVLFLGHGSPMNAIEENEFVAGWREAGRTLPRPKCHTVHFGTLGDSRDLCHGHGETGNHP